MTGMISTDPEICIRRFFAQHPQLTCVTVAYSGGMDSEVLLYALAQVRRDWSALAVQAVHVQHGLQAQAPSWVDHCRQTCSELGIALQVEYIRERPAAGESIEAWARRVRYQCLAAYANTATSAVFCAHHQDDQAETLLLNLLRGTGPAGLGGMPMLRRLGVGWLARPLLDCQRSQLAQYAAEHRLNWVEDPSNTNPAMDRNFLRQQVLPLLRQHWPAASPVIARCAGFCASQTAVLSQYLTTDLALLQGSIPGTLSVTRLQQVDLERRAWLVRQWLKTKGLALPSSVKLANALATLLSATLVGSPCQTWTGAELRRYRDDLYALPTLCELPAEIRVTPSSVIDIDGLGRYCFKPGIGAGFRWPDAGGGDLRFRFRLGGERIRLSPKGGQQLLKSLFQQWGVPPWLRVRIPLLYAENTLLAVADLAISCEHRVAADEVGYTLQRC